jgi:hypothetical protein
MPVMSPDLDPNTLAQARRLNEVLKRLAASTAPDTQERAMLVACLEKLLPDEDYEALFMHNEAELVRRLNDRDRAIDVNIDDL